MFIWFHSYEKHKGLKQIGTTQRKIAKAFRKKLGRNQWGRKVKFVTSETATNFVMMNMLEF